MNLLNTQQAAERLGVDASRIRQLILEGRLPSAKIGRDHVINAEDLALVSDRKLGRPKKPDQGETASPAANVTATAAQPKKAVGKGEAATKRKTKAAAVTPAPKLNRTGKKGKA